MMQGAGADLVRGGRALLTWWELGFLVGVGAAERLSKRQHQTLSSIAPAASAAALARQGGS
jgi:hypothetical protein